MPDGDKNNLPRVQSTSALGKYLGLSRCTVSRVLNHHEGVKPATRDRVLKTMRELGFTPNPMARGLKGKTLNIGICLQELDSSPLLARKTSLLQHSLRERNYRGILEFTSGVDELEIDTIRHFLALRVDGIILVGSKLTADHEILTDLKDTGKPIVVIDPVQTLPFPMIRVDRAVAMKLAIEHLYDLGHRRFAFLGISDDVPYGKDRLVALRREIPRKGLSMRDDVEQISIPRQPHYDFDYGYELAGQFLQLSNPPSGIIALNDRIAIGAMKRFAESGARIPEDYAIIGFDNQDMTRYCLPDLTTIDQEVPSVIGRAIKVLFEQIENGAELNEEHMPVHFISPGLRVRGSTGPENVCQDFGPQTDFLKDFC